MQAKAEAKLRKVQERAEAERRAKAEKTQEWHKQQHEREQQRLKVPDLYKSCRNVAGASWPWARALHSRARLPCRW